MKKINFKKTITYSIFIFVGMVLAIAISVNAALPHKSAGEQLKATEWNAIIDSINNLTSRVAALEASGGMEIKFLNTPVTEGALGLAIGWNTINLSNYASIPNDVKVVIVDGAGVTADNNFEFYCKPNNSTPATYITRSYSSAYTGGGATVADMGQGLCAVDSGSFLIYKGGGLDSSKYDIRIIGYIK